MSTVTSFAGQNATSYKLDGLYVTSLGHSSIDRHQERPTLYKGAYLWVRIEGAYIYLVVFFVNWIASKEKPGWKFAKAAHMFSWCLFRKCLANIQKGLRVWMHVKAYALKPRPGGCLLPIIVCECHQQLRMFWHETNWRHLPPASPSQVSLLREIEKNNYWSVTRFDRWVHIKLASPISTASWIVLSATFSILKSQKMGKMLLSTMSS